MGKCYLCGQDMIDRPADYHINPEKYKSLALRHEEHIIQNSIYGRLTNNDILCETCGGKLADDIDGDFCKIFEGITEQLKHIFASKDHGNNNYNRTLKGYIFKAGGSKIEVHIKGGKVVPKNPDYDYIESEKKVKIYCPPKVAKNYQIFVKNELSKKGIDINHITIEIIDDISGTGNLGVFFSEGVVDFNKKFKLGLNKIATGFAVANGIDRNQLPCTLNIADKKIIFTSNVVPFYPYATFDFFIEPFRAITESEYPTHTLILYTDDFSNKKILVCYIDLFSTFQFYVILNHNYKGENIQKVYYQTVLKQQKPEINIKGVRMKYLNIVAEEIGVSFQELEGKSIDEIYNYLEIKYNQMTMPYELDLSKYISNISNRVSINLIMKNAGLTSHLSSVEKEILEATPEMDSDDIISMYHEINRIENEQKINYRQNYIEVRENSHPTMYSTLFKMIEMNNISTEPFKSFGHLKFYQLTQFIRMNDPKSPDTITE